jgi:hypothetical protein
MSEKRTIINTEDPYEHWIDLYVKDQIVLDLGCGRFESEKDGFEYTPPFFVRHGAKHVIGVDASAADIEWYKRQYPYSQNTFIFAIIDNKDMIVDLLNKYKPTSLKVDIEHYETNFYDISKEEMESVKYMAIETHTNEIHLCIKNKIIEWGFTIDNDVPLYCDPNRVIFCSK